MRAIEKAILQTLAYADVFNYPLKSDEIYFYLIAKRKFARGTVLGALEKILTDLRLISTDRELYYLAGREETVGLRKTREKWSKKKIKKAKKIARLLKVIPTVKLVGISGALAMGNADEGDDIDLFIVTSAGRLWLTRLLVTVLVELAGQRRKPGVSLANFSTLRVENPQPEGFSLGSLKIIRVDPFRRPRRLSNYFKSVQAAYLCKSKRSELPLYKDKICLNMFVDEDHLVVPPPEQNLFTAHEVVQMKPLWDRDDVYRWFLEANLWVGDYLPNAIKMSNVKCQNSKLQLKSQNERKEKWLNGYMVTWLDSLEKLSMTLQLKYMAKRRATEKISPGRILFHPEDKGEWVMGEYQERIANLNE